MKRLVALLAVLLVSGLLASSTPGGVPHLINYQGVLTGGGGTAVTDTVDLTFKIYPDSVASDSILWSETHNSVIVDRGLFHVILGTTVPVGAAVFDGPNRWIGISVAGESEMTPRMRLATVPFAFRATVADTAAVIRDLAAHSHSSLGASDGDPPAVVYVDSLGNVGVGVTDPSENLDVAGSIQAQGLKLPTGASENFILTSDSAGAATWQPSTGGRVPEIRYADMFPGANAGEKIAAAIADLPDGGGVVDARGFSGEQVINNNLFAGLSKDLTLLLGHATFLIGTSQSLSSDTRVLVIRGQGYNTILKPTTSMFVISAFVSRGVLISDMRFELGGTNSGAIYIVDSFAFKNVIERISVHVTALTSRPLIKIGETTWIDALFTTIRDCTLNGSSFAGVEVQSNAALVEAVNFGFCDVGVLAGTGTSGTTIINNSFEHVTHALKATNAYGITFANNRLENGGSRKGENIIVRSVTGVSIRDNYITHINGGAQGVYVESSSGVVIERNQFNGDAPSNAIVFADGTSESVFLASNVVTGSLPVTFGGFGYSPLLVNDVTATQSSEQGAFAKGLTVNSVIHLTPTDSLPPNPVMGTMFISSTDSTLYVWDGAQWKACW